MVRSINNKETNLVNHVSKVCDIAPLILGIGVMAATIACFVCMLVNGFAPAALGFGIVGGIVLIVLTDYLPGMFEAVSKRRTKAQ